METPYKLAEQYYPRLWDKSRIEELVKAGRLTEAEAAQIMKEQGGKEYVGYDASEGGDRE